MKVLPAINCESFDCMQNRIPKLKEIGSNGVHIDVSDGHFASSVTWNEPERLFRSFDLNDIFVEVHMMVSEPQRFLSRWLGAGADRVIVHIESSFIFEEIRQTCDKYDSDLMISLSSSVAFEKIEPFLDRVEYVQFLAVPPGPSGQSFREGTLDKIKSLRSKNSDVKIEVDGGVNVEVAKKIKEAGSDIAVAGSYIFENDDLTPQEAFNKLRQV